MSNLITQHGSEHQKRVAEFMRGAGQAVPDEITMPNLDTRRLRARLILEEALETIDALGVAAKMPFEGFIDMRDIEFCDDHLPNMEAIADGCCDLSVVLQGTLLACGLPDTPFIEEVDAANLRKLDGGWVDEHGKFKKPASWTPPDIRAVLSRVTGG